MTRAHTPMLLAALLGACSSQPKVTPAELESAVEAALVDQRPCIGDKTWHFPLDAPTADRSSADGVQALDALAAAGLLESTETTTTASTFTLGPDGGSRDREVPAKRYVLADSGQAVYRKYDVPGYGRVGAFCYGEWQAEVLGFTDPSESSSGNLTTVTYSRRLTGVPGWAQNPVLAARSSLQARGSGTGGDSEPNRMWLLRTDSGWVRTGQ